MFETVAINQIESELDRIWKDTHGGVQVKGCLFNLVIFAHQAHRTDYLKKVVKTFIDKFPCRILFLETDPSYPQGKLEVQVTNRASMDHETTLGSDQILIRLSEDQLEKAPFIVLPHLVPDLPIYLLWGQTPKKADPILPHLINYASRLIVDAESIDELQGFCQDVLQYQRKKSIDFMDVNWALISGWRNVLFQVFEKEEQLEKLSICTDLVIHFNHRKTEYFHNVEAQAIYLQGWLASQLNWHLQQMERKGEEFHITYQINGTNLHVRLIPTTHETCRPGAVTGLEFSFRDNSHIEMKRIEELSKVTVYCSTEERCDLPFNISLPNLQRSFAFMKALFYSRIGDHYYQMLETLSQISWKKSNG